MKLLILVSLIAAGAADTVRSYVPPPYSGAGHSVGGSGFVSSGSGFVSGGSGFGSSSSRFVSGGSSFGFDSSDEVFSGVGGISVGGGGITFGSGVSGGGCGPGQVRHVDGNCVVPQVTRNLYVFNGPEVEPIVGPPPQIPLPQVRHNVILVHASDSNVRQNTFVVPPAEERNTLYILQRTPEVEQEVIHLPETQKPTPDVFFVNYRDGDNPTLPTGEKLQDALVAASQGGSRVIGGGGIQGGGISVGGGFGGVGGVGGFGGSGVYGVTTPSTLYGAP
ncbi:uncharacterized protein [Panulirus ornatus]|uniref:uncharacterized protein n=1 Tax=Panulirus ornatus TaxID=150431 RepID=UPI003A8C34A1